MNIWICLYFMNATDHTGDLPCSPNLTQTLRGFKTRVCLPRYCRWIFFFSVCESQITSFGIHVQSAWFHNISQSSFHRLRPWQWKLTRTLLRTLVFSVFRSSIELFFFLNVLLLRRNFSFSKFNKFVIDLIISLHLLLRS